MTELSNEEFEKLAKEQVAKYPDLLLFDDEEGIINAFYEQYRRKRNV